LESQVPVFITPRNRVAQLYHWALGFFATSYSSQGYSGSILTWLHMGYHVNSENGESRNAIIHNSSELYINPLLTYNSEEAAIITTSGSSTISILLFYRDRFQIYSIQNFLGNFVVLVIIKATQFTNCFNFLLAFKNSNGH
jgi:hypothetical protein